MRSRTGYYRYYYFAPVLVCLGLLFPFCKTSDRDDNLLLPTNKTFSIDCAQWPGRLGNHILSILSAYAYAEMSGQALRFCNCSHNVLDLKATGIEQNCGDLRMSLKEAFWVFIRKNPSTTLNRFSKAQYLSLNLPVRTKYDRIAFPLLSKFSNPSLADELRNTLVVHIRSGDVWWIGPNAAKGRENYLPPPLSFYIDVIESHRATNIIVVSEPGKVSPIVLQLLKRYPGKLRLQAADLHKDVATIFNARNLVLSQGSFAYTISLGSRSLRKIWYFNTRVWEISPVWKNVEIVQYTDDEYVASLWPWNFTEAQKQMVLSHNDSFQVTRFII